MGEGGPRRGVTYVYILQGIAHPAEVYTGLTDYLRNRLKEHNAGESVHTRKFMPWRLVTYLAFFGTSEGGGV
jgi:predicted GIY-YIG superfamily endonuclease